MRKNWIEDGHLRLLEKHKLSKDLTVDQRATLEKIDSLLVMKGYRPATRLRFAYKAVRLGRFLKKPYEQATREDLAAFFSHLTRTHAPESLRYLKSFVRRFYTFLLSPYDEKVPEVVSWIKVQKTRVSHKKPPDLFRPEDVLKLLEKTSSIRDRALISVLYESGTRISELCGLAIGDLEFDEYGARITVDGKTGVRRVRLIQSAADLRNWLNHHPRRTNPDAPLFVRFRGIGYLEPLMPSSVRTILKTLCRSAGITKPCNPHAFRKARATELSQRLTPSELSVYHGWVQGSGMPQIYIHLAGDDVEKKLLRQAGILKEEKAQANPLAARICTRCNESNSPASVFCSRCSCPVNDEAATPFLKEENRFRRMAPELLSLLEDPEVALLLAKKVNARAAGSKSTTASESSKKLDVVPGVSSRHENPGRVA